jgi:xylose isomerase
MAKPLKLASNLCPFSPLRDRFVPEGYTGKCAFPRQLEKLAAMDGISGVALGWPGPYKNAAELKRRIGDYGLKLSTLEPNLYSERQFKNGSFTHPDSKIRRAAIDRTRATIDAALEADAADINLWLGQDGFDYLLAAHYEDAWKWLMEGLQIIADYNRAMPISLEYKSKEPRANQYVANVGKALFIANKIDRPHFGITLDFGHSLAALESPAEAVVLALREGRLQQVHLNDNYRDWDHDLIPGAVNVWDHVDFFYWIRKLGFRGWFSIDCFPYREDGTQALERAVQVFRKCGRIADRLMEMNVEKVQREGNHLEILRILWEMIE